MDNVIGMQASKDRIVALRNLFLMAVESEMRTAAEFGAKWNFGNFTTEDRARRSVFGDLSASVFDAVDDVTAGIDRSIDETQSQDWSDAAADRRRRVTLEAAE